MRAKSVFHFAFLVLLHLLGVADVVILGPVDPPGQTAGFTTHSYKSQEHLYIRVFSPKHVKCRKKVKRGMEWKKMMIRGGN